MPQSALKCTSRITISAFSYGEGLRTGIFLFHNSLWDIVDIYGSYPPKWHKFHIYTQHFLTKSNKRLSFSVTVQYFLQPFTHFQCRHCGVKTLHKPWHLQKHKYLVGLGVLLGSHLRVTTPQQPYSVVALAFQFNKGKNYSTHQSFNGN